MKTNIFHLQIIPTSAILCHEEYDPSRARPLVERLRQNQQLANPIIVAELDKEKYLQLDGMNRLSAFKILGFSSILAQVIDYNDQEMVELSSWCHLFRADQDKFLHFIEKIDKIFVKEGRMENVGHRYIKEEGLGRLCTLIKRRGSVYLINCNGNLLEKIQYLTKIVSFYKKKIVRDVLSVHANQTDIEILFGEHKNTNFMLVFPTFTRHQIVEIVKKGGFFPAGITRHIIKKRCLNVNLPLKIFASRNSIKEQNKEMEELLLARNFRCYEEPTVYFE